MHDFQESEFANRAYVVLDLVRKFEIITREYNEQNKDFSFKHEEVRQFEQDHRQAIKQNFDDHVASLYQELN